MRTMTKRFTGHALRVAEKATNAESLQLQIIDLNLDVPSAGQALIEVMAAAVNPSDVKAALGMMPHATWPRTPGRDYAGRVVAGPADWEAAEVWGTGGDLGITRDGSHAKFLTLPLEALSRKPESISMVGAATVGVPFITAYEGLRRAQLRGAGQTVAVFGASGKVGQAAVQLAARAGASVLAVGRVEAECVRHNSEAVRFVDGTRTDLGAAILEATGGHGADIAYNTVGSPYFAAALESLCVGGTQVLIATIDRSVPFDILAFYRRNLLMLGVDSLKLSSIHCAAILDQLRPGFDDGTLKAYDVGNAAMFPLEQAATVYRQVLEGARERMVFTP